MNSYAEALTNVTVFGGRAFKEAIKVKCRAGLSSKGLESL